MLKRNFILLSLVGLVLVISTTFEDKNTDVEVLPNNEDIDLSIVFKNLDANIALTSEEYIVINLWATWCTPCIEEVGYLQKLNELDEFRALIKLSVLFSLKKYILSEKGSSL